MAQRDPEDRWENTEHPLRLFRVQDERPNKKLTRTHLEWVEFLIKSLLPPG
jgi:hypothetical protein